ncbi:outer membrane beta-barrel protein [Pedobacter sp. L105]|uniref:outer membrane beta-barrel protein n=1 Tax=Pedobacter sp. L105 TaxID=1641871 RepID=UPI00131BE16D|nr:outer membrane beta-barrel protein [Pedobacter sp. L105]
MKLPFLSIFFLILLSMTAAAQNVNSVKGSVADTTTNHQLINASVSVLQSKDSVLVDFTQVDENGTFSITDLPKGKLFLLVTYPGYADYVEQFSVDSTKKSIDFGKIRMILKATLLNNVIIKGKAAAIKIKGDTTEFNASAFVIQPNSKVEDLLKQLPGIQVDKHGKITAQGQTVTKVLVDGEEFFGDDPTLVTKNLRGDMIDKVQLYDKKSDQAAFTGVDDGKTDKTINLKLKEDKKNGYFGKIEASGATDKYYEEQGMFNYFKGKQKFSAYGTLANTGKIGLGWSDNSKYGVSQVEAFDGGFYINASNDDLESYNGQYNDQGIPVARTGGTHYETKWNEDKESINANYKVGSLGVTGTNNTITQTNLPTGAFNTVSGNDFNNFMFRQKLDGSYQIKLDTTSTLKISVDGTIKNSQTRSNIDTKSTRGNDVLLNESQRNLDNDAHNKLFNTKLFYTKKLNKPRRTLSVTLTEAVTNTDTKGYLKSDNEYYNTTGVRDSSSVVNQYKTSLLKSSVFTSNIAYTEPLTKNLALVVNYGLGINNSSANRQSFNPAANGSYTLLDSIYSNNFKLNQVFNQGGLILNFKSNKHTLNFGSRISDISFDQTNLIDNSTLKRNFLSWKPQLNYNYKFAPQTEIYVYYSGTGVQPTLDQIQPVRVNNDPLNIILGNPDLKQSFQQNINIRFNSNKVITGRSIYGYLNYSVTNNPIVSNTVTDSAGKSVISYTNLPQKKSSSVSSYFTINQKIKALDIGTGLSLNANGNTSYSYINGALNKVTGATYGGNFSFYKSKDNKYDIYGSFGPTYTTNESSIQQQLNDNGWGWRGNASFTIYLPGKFEIGSDLRYEYRAKTESFDTNFSRVILNAVVSKKFLKSQGLKLSFSGNDLLNQNKGFSRSASGNMITQNDYTTIRRYFMGSISWDFSKMGGSTSKK